jgi:chromatin remodeling complex protein RSC6
MPNKKAHVEKTKKKTVSKDKAVVEKKLSASGSLKVDIITDAPAVVNEDNSVQPVNEDNSAQQVNVDPGIASTISSLFDALVANGEDMLLSQRVMLQLVKKTSKAYTRDCRDFDKNLARTRRQHKKDPNRKKREPSGFAVATDISDKLCDFLGVGRGTQLSRTDVTRKVTSYIREKNLQIAENRRSFVPDNGLQDILGPLQDIDKEKGFTYFNLQRYITPHITSSASTSSASSS